MAGIACKTWQVNPYDIQSHYKQVDCAQGAKLRAQAAALSHCFLLFPQWRVISLLLPDAGVVVLLLLSQF
jgi:hypothetical protein